MEVGEHPGTVCIECGSRATYDVGPHPDNRDPRRYCFGKPVKRQLEMFNATTTTLQSDRR